MSLSVDLIKKYNVAGPRYTSYPTVPYWDQKIAIDDWKSTVIRAYEESKDEGISLYIHLPFCESLCTFCGCHKRITKNHSVELPYIDAVLKEWELYVGLLGSKPKIKELHLGGGTPTFFSTENLKKIIKGLINNSTPIEGFEYSFEAHPNSTTKEQLQTLYDLGFRRVSFGIQDYDQKVQKTINRVQTFEQVKKVHDWAKEIGYTSISHDLVFGLPHQTLESIEMTIDRTNTLKPDRIAFYSYAHVPWIKGVGQRGYDEKDLPKDDEKRQLYETGKQLLADNEYVEIGMDHFALESDSLYQSMERGNLHRNFMGYTTQHTQLMIGLGMSAISDSWYAFAQNSKSVEEYIELVSKGELPIFRGHLLTHEDLVVRKHILNLMCQFETECGVEDYFYREEVRNRLQPLLEDGLVAIDDEEQIIQVTEKGKAFVRNVCMCFDLKLHRNRPETRLFSQTV